jgi:uncharacterized protein YfeS
MKEEPYGINKTHAHPRAIDLIPEDFFWDCVDELAPFGSDEGDSALSDFRRWRKLNPDEPTYECLKGTIEGVGEIELKYYNESILNRELIEAQLTDENFNDQQYITILDDCVIATGFAQLVDEGKIDEVNKPLIKLAIDRQSIWAELDEDWDWKEEYMNRLEILARVLIEA